MIGHIGVTLAIYDITVNISNEKTDTFTATLIHIKR